MPLGRFTFVAALAAMVLAACSPSRGASSDVAERSGGTPTAPKSLTLPLRGEPTDSFITTIFGGSGTILPDLAPAVHQPLAFNDEGGVLHPRLAVELPTQANGLWAVRPDGTMQTTYRIRNDVTWHDGTRLTARDFVFGWTVARDPEVPMSSRFLASQIARIDAPDEFTVVMDWTKTYPFAGNIVEYDLGPLPGHILELIYQDRKAQLAGQPYWHQEFVGVGPYRVADWQPGSHLVLKTYDGFFGGRAKIDTLTFQFLTDASVTMANVLAGSLDGAFHASTDFGQLLLIKNEWERAGKHPVAFTEITHWQFIDYQFRPDVATPKDILDARVRRGLAYALDRTTLADALFGGLAPVSHSFIPQDNPKWDWVKQGIALYPYDPRRSQETLESAGWRRAPDGTYVNTTGEPVVFPFWGGQSEAGGRETAIIHDSWKSNGIIIEPVVRPQALLQDLKFRANFPSIETTSIPLKFPGNIQRAYGALCPTEQSRWAGGNRGCYQNPEMDRIVEALGAAIDPVDQQRLYRELAKMQSEDLPIFPLYFPVNLSLLREGVVGVKGNTKPASSLMWNVSEWDIIP